MELGSNQRGHGIYFNEAFKRQQNGWFEVVCKSGPVYAIGDIKQRYEGINGGIILLTKIACVNFTLQ